MNTILFESSKSILIEQIYKATTHGDVNFHKYCDNKGPTVVLIKANDYVFGGYSKLNWDGVKSKFNTDTTSFLFSLTKKEKYPIKTSIYAIYNVSKTYILGYGYPDGIILFENFLTKSTNTGLIGACYGYSNKETPLAGNKKEFKVQELEVYTLYQLP